MTTITPPPPSLPLPAQPGALPTVTVANPPSALLKATIGSRLEALILGPDPKGGFQVRTPLGDFSLNTPLALPKGANLLVSLQTIAPRVQFQIVSVDGKPPATALGLAARAGQATPGTAGGTLGATGGPGGLPFVSLTAGNTVTATLLQSGRALAPPLVPEGQRRPGAPGQGGGAAGSGVADVAKAAVSAAKNGLQGFARLAGGGTAPASSLFGKPAPTVQPTANAATAPGSGPVAGGQAPQSVAPAHSVPLPAGTQVSVRIVSLQAPQQSGAQAQPAATTPAPKASAGPVLLEAGRTFTTTVTGTTATGQPTVSSPAGELALNTRAPVTVGTGVTLEVRGTPIPPSPLPGAFGSLGTDAGLTARDWPTLKEAVEVLQEANPAAAQHLTNALIPRPDANLGATMLLFLSAMRGGDLRGWLGGDSLRILDRARPGLVGRLKDDFGQRSKQGSDRASGDWRVAAVPIQVDGEIEQIRFMSRSMAEEQGEQGALGTRFVVDATLSRLGHLQLDGLVRDDRKHLDLILRSEQPLPDAVQDGIRKVFETAAEVSGITGGLGFQAAPANFIEVEIAGPADDDHRGVVV